MFLRALLFLIIAGLPACASFSAPPPAPDVELTSGTVQLQADGSLVNAIQPVQERVVLKSAALRLVIESAESALADITQLTDEMGGWVVSSNSSRIALASGHEVTRASITVRVPAERFDDALATFKAGALSVDSETIDGQDVTQEYVDLTSRITNLEAAEQQLQTIMDSATRTEDVLNVHNELVRIRGEIEVARGQLRYYDESAAFSSISIELVPEALETPIQIAGWSPEGTARSAFLALLNVLRFLADAAITLVILVLPLVLIVGLPSVLAYRWLKRRGWLPKRSKVRVVE